MSKTTTTLMEVYQSELINSGYNEFWNNGHLTFHDDNFQFIKKVLAYDNDIHRITTQIVFQNFSFDNSTIDKFYKRLFVSRFYSREIGRQTIEDFSSQVVYETLVRSEYIQTILSDLMAFILATTENTTDGMQNNTARSATLTNDIPQNETNLDLNIDYIAWANNNTINKYKNESDNTQNSKSETKNLDNLIKSRELLNEVFDIIDKNCFLQRW